MGTFPGKSKLEFHIIYLTIDQESLTISVYHHDNCEEQVLKDLIIPLLLKVAGTQKKHAPISPLKYTTHNITSLLIRQQLNRFYILL